MRDQGSNFPRDKTHFRNWGKNIFHNMSASKRRLLLSVIDNIWELLADNFLSFKTQHFWKNSLTIVYVSFPVMTFL